MEPSPPSKEQLENIETWAKAIETECMKYRIAGLFNARFIHEKAKDIIAELKK